MASEETKTESVLTTKQQTVATDLYLVPRVSEKAQNLAASRKYVFLVPTNANKVTIGKAVEKQYGAKVLMVNIVRMEGKSRRYGKTPGRLSDYKKAIVTLTKDSKEISFGEVA